MLLIRTDASADIGFGHVTRMAYLADQIKKNTAVVICTKPGAAEKFLLARRVPWRAASTAPALLEQGVKALLFDLRHFSAEDRALLAQANSMGILTVQSTDLGLEQQPVQVTVDCSPAKMIPYAPDKEVLSGPQFTLLHQRFRHFHRLQRPYSKKAGRVLLALGGGVEYRTLRDMIDMLLRLRVQIKIAGGFVLRKAHRKILRRLYPNVHFVGKSDSLARAFFEADVAVITPGISAYEAAACGTPALYVWYDEFQAFTARALSGYGAGIAIAKIGAAAFADFQSAYDALGLEQRIQMGRAGKELVDGYGIYRLLAFFRSKGVIA